MGVTEFELEGRTLNSDQSINVLEEQLKFDQVDASFLSAYSFATRKERIILGVSCFAAFIAGVCQILPTVGLILRAKKFLD